MSQSAEEKALKILNGHLVGVLSTVEDNKPIARYMTFFNIGFQLYTASSARTEKVNEVEKNNHVHVLIGYSGEGLSDSYLEISGISEVNDTAEMKHKVWNDKLEGWFEGPDDPDYIVLSIKPQTIRVMNTKGGKPEEVIL